MRGGDEARLPQITALASAQQCVYSSYPHLPLNIEWNGAWFGHPNGSEMNFSFYDLIAHAAKTRRLRAGTIIGSGTVSTAAPVRPASVNAA